MKQFRLAFLLLFGLFFSCSDETNPTSDTTYFPIKAGNYWTYDYTSPNFNEVDSIYVSNDTLIENSTFKKIRSTNLPFGFYSNSLNKNSVRINSSKVVLTGEVNYNFGNTIPINFELSNFVLFDEEASANQQLDNITGTLTRDYENYPLTIDYKLTSTALETVPSFTASSGTTYESIKKVKTTLNLKITTSVSITGFPNPIVITILNSQDVLNSIHYYSKNIGMVFTETSLNYQLQDLSQLNITLPLPQSGNEVQQENLAEFLIVN